MTFQMIILTYLKKLMSPDTKVIGGEVGMMAVQRDVFLLKHFWEKHMDELGQGAFCAMNILEMLTNILYCSTIDEVRINFEHLLEVTPMITTMTLKCILQHSLGANMEIMNDVIAQCEQCVVNL
jgi:hypothetical protein